VGFTLDLFVAAHEIFVKVAAAKRGHSAPPISGYLTGYEKADEQAN
jgi:hypothetical protein